MESWCGFNLHFSLHKWSWISFICLGDLFYIIFIIVYYYLLPIFLFSFLNIFSPQCFKVETLYINSDSLLSVMHVTHFPSLHLPFNSAYGIFGYAKGFFLHCQMYKSFTLSHLGFVAEFEVFPFPQVTKEFTRIFSSIYMVSLSLSCVGCEILLSLCKYLSSPNTLYLKVSFCPQWFAITALLYTEFLCVLASRSSSVGHTALPHCFLQCFNNWGFVVNFNT